jgi:hypothetical protein
VKRIGTSLVAVAISGILALVGCGASAGNGFDDGDASAPGSHSRANGDGGETSFSSGDAATGGSRSATQTDAGSDADVETADAAAGPASYCLHNTTGSCGGVSESYTFTGTATETSPLAGAPQALTLTLTGNGIAGCWTLNEGHTVVAVNTSLWGALATNPDDPSTFTFSLGGASISGVPPEDGRTCSNGGFNGFYLNAPERGTHFSGTFCNDGISYDIELDPPAGTAPCVALPNCAYSDNPLATNCGGSIDGYPDDVYQCNGTATPPTLVQTCTGSTHCELVGKEDMAACD